MFVDSCRLSLRRASAVLVLALFVSAPAWGQVSATSGKWSRCKLDCDNAGGGPVVVRECKKLCDKPATTTGLTAGAMAPPSTVNASPTPKPVAPKGSTSARRVP